MARTDETTNAANRQESDIPGLRVSLVCPECGWLSKVLETKARRSGPSHQTEGT